MAEIVFDIAQQKAVLGHALQNPSLWMQLDEWEVVQGWFSSQRLQALFVAASGFRDRYARPPTAAELLSFIQEKEVGEEVAAYTKAIAECLRFSSGIGLDVLQERLAEWKRSVTIAESAKEVADLWNRGKHKEAQQRWFDGTLTLQRIEAVSGAMPDRMEPMAERLGREQESRNAAAANHLQYGISFLDDFLVGMDPSEFIVVGARTGIGKTQIAKMIAEHIAAEQKKTVAAFFLEASESEIESRTMFNEVMKMHRIETGYDPDGERFEYPEWKYQKMSSELAEKLKSYEPQCREIIAEKYKKLYTYYRSRGDFGLKELDREILRLRDKTGADMIVLDHLHYIDNEDDNNENTEMKRLLKKLRDITTTHRTPVLAISHLKKGAGKTIVPALDDYHGASDITKIATVAIMLATCPTFKAAETHHLPTFMRVLKGRDAGNRSKYVGVIYYNQEEGVYDPRYTLGTLNYSESSWKPLLPSRYPFWSPESRNIRNVIEVEK